MSLTFRSTSWPGEYGGSFESPEDEDEELPFEVNTSIETDDWSQGIHPMETPRPMSIYFVDGVQRLECTGALEDDDRIIEAALYSVSVGGVDCQPDEAFIAQSEIVIARILAIASLIGEVNDLQVPSGNVLLRFAVERPSGPGLSGRGAINDVISRKRHELERQCAEKAIAEGRLVIVDGRLTSTGGTSNMVGLVKTIHERYLRDPEWRLVPHLSAGQRTPVFRIDYERGSRYAWFLRLPNTRPFDHSLAGIVRLETREVGDEEAKHLANLTCFHLPVFASRPEKDARAPQNLLPIAGLEWRLRHGLGDSTFIRRAIDRRVAQELA